VKRKVLVSWPSLRRIRQRDLRAYLDALENLQAALKVYEDIHDSPLGDIRDGLRVEPGPLTVKRKGRGWLFTPHIEMGVSRSEDKAEQCETNESKLTSSYSGQW